MTIEEQHAHKKQQVLQRLKEGFSMGHIYRELDVPERLIKQWRNAAGIKAKAQGNFDATHQPKTK